jgi:hypothetical protein
VPEPDPAVEVGVATSFTGVGEAVAVGVVGVGAAELTGAAEETGAAEALGAAEEAGLDGAEPDPPPILKSMQDS